MRSLAAVKNILKRPFASSQSQTNPEQAYDLWALSYDDQPDNLMLALDEEIFSILIDDISFKEKIIVDIGCGTGRHWKKLLSLQPKKLIGYDVSEGMLSMLKKKFPGAETNNLDNNCLGKLDNESCDVIICTLTIAHIENLGEAMNEWNRVLKTNGEIVLTDYHPELLSKGGNRTFKHNEEIIAVKNNIYTVDQIQKKAVQLGWKQICFSEKKIDESVKSYYEKHNALHLFRKFQNVPVIYGIHLKKINAAR